MSDQTTLSSDSIADNPYQLLQISPNPDGSIERPEIFPIISSNSDLSDPSISVLTKDVTINQSNKTWVRLFLPRKALDDSSSPTSTTTKLPLIVFFHGGGFILLSAASSIIHDFCSNMATAIDGLVASVEYRLAPEHRLPAAYDDALEALHWMKTTDEVWLREYADYSSCYLMGASAGANMAYHVGLRVAADVHQYKPLKIQGLILHQPFFGGTQRSGSELRFTNAPLIPLCVTDLMWELSLPIGVDRDHEYCNAMLEGGSKLVDGVGTLGWRILVVGCDGDPLVDRQMELVEVLEEKGVPVVGLFSLGHGHAFELFDAMATQSLFQEIKNFIYLSK